MTAPGPLTREALLDAMYEKQSLHADMARALDAVLDLLAADAERLDAEYPHPVHDGFLDYADRLRGLRGER